MNKGGDSETPEKEVGIILIFWIMKKLKNLMKQFILPVASISLLLSCSQELVQDVSDYTKPINPTLENMSIDYSNIVEDLDLFWNCAIDNYTLPVVCGCTCSDFSLLDDILASCGSNFSFDLNFNLSNDYSCSQLEMMFRLNCQYSDLSEYQSDIISALSILPFVTDDEIAFMSNILYMENPSDFDIIALREEWANLTSNSNLDNNFSLIFLEMSNAVWNFQGNNPDVLDEHQGLWKIGTIAVGAIGGAIGTFVQDVWKNGECGPCSDLEWEDVVRGASWGALMGATS